jgi:hypothetical protein
MLMLAVVGTWKLRHNPSADTVLVPVITSPEGAMVRLNQKVTCITPNCRISLPSGNHELQVAKAGYETFNQVLTITPRQTIKPLHFHLQALKQVLQISTNFESGKVSLNGVPIASLQDGQFLMQELPYGNHILNVHGLDADASVGFEVAPGQAPTITGGPEAKEAQAIAVSALGTAVHIACNCAEPIALDGRMVGNIGPAGLDAKDIAPGTHQVKIGKSDNQHTVTISTGEAPVLDLFLASNRNVGTLVIETKQTGADILVNGKKYGKPSEQPLVRIPLVPKTYQVAVRKQGYRAPAVQQAEIHQNQDTKLVFNLEPEPATLLVRGGPADAQISIDGTRVGTAGPRGSFSGNVPPGEHVIELSKSGFGSRWIRKQFNPGATVILNRQETQIAELRPATPVQPGKSERRAPDVSNVESKSPESVSTPSSPAPSGPAQEWERIASSRDTAVLENFRKKYPDTPFARQAGQKIEQLDWESSKSAGDTAALRAFLLKYPHGLYSESAKASLANLDTQRTASERQAIRDVLRHYSEAYDRKDAEQVAALHPALNNKDLKKVRDSFKAAQSVQMTLRPLEDPQINGERATVTCARSLQYTFKDGTPGPIKDTVRIELSKQRGLWIIESVH